MPESNSLAPKSGSDPNESTTPEDVATLYSWANLHGAKYRDFSASRAQAREEARLRVEEAQAEERRRQQEEAERIAQEEAQIAARLAAEAAEAARQAEAERLAEIARQAEAERQAVLAAQEAQRQAAQQRTWQPASPEAYQGNFPSAFAGSEFAASDPHSVPDAGYASQFSYASFPGMTPGREVNTPSSRSSDHEGQFFSGPAPRQAQQDEGMHAQQRLSANTGRYAQDQISESAPARPAQYPSEDRNASIPDSSIPASPNQNSPGFRSSGQSPFQPGAINATSAPSRSNEFQSPAMPALESSSASSYPDFGPSSYGPFSPQTDALSPSQRDSYNLSPWHPQDSRDFRESREPVSRPAWLAPEQPLAQQPAMPSSQSAQVSIAQSQFRAQYQPPVQQPTPSPYRADSVNPAQAQQPIYIQPPQPALMHAGQTPGAPPTPTSGPAANHPQFSAPNPSPVSLGRQNSGPVDDTLVGSRDRIASRWFALKSVFDPQSAPVEQVPAQPPARVPALAVFSLAGGVGKTSLVASLGRALSARGERVLLVDTAAYGLLPFFFGARDQRPGMLRTFNPPGVSADAPIQLVTIDPDGHPAEQPANNASSETGQSYHPAGPAASNTNQPDWLAEEVVRYTRSANRVLIDLPTASGSTTRRILRLAPVVLVPVLADMNSVVSVGAIESFFRNSVGARDASGKPIMPYYVLNQFDYSLPLHLDVREILREQIGDRLLPFALRRSPAVSEALAEGMTVMDYAPTAVVAEDYANLAGWVRGLSAPATQSYRGVRWSER